MGATCDRNYSNFQCKNIDWDDLYSFYRAKISPETTNRELFIIMMELLKQLDDKHVYIRKFNKVFASNLKPRRGDPQSAAGGGPRVPR